MEQDNCGAGDEIDERDDTPATWYDENLEEEFLDSFRGIFRLCAPFSAEAPKSTCSGRWKTVGAVKAVLEERP